LFLKKLPKSLILHGNCPFLRNSLPVFLENVPVSGILTGWKAANSRAVPRAVDDGLATGDVTTGRQKALIRFFGTLTMGKLQVAVADWAVCLKAAHPGYIGWEEFMANQRRLADNINRYGAGHSGVPRKGSALLQGIAICGRCGRRMSLR
jgi:hypothetical protein